MYTSEGSVATTCEACVSSVNISFKMLVEGRDETTIYFKER